MDTPKHQRSLEFKPVLCTRRGLRLWAESKNRLGSGRKAIGRKRRAGVFFMGCRVVPYVEKLKNKL